jgi:hypothetical protein
MLETEVGVEQRRRDRRAVTPALYGNNVIVIKAKACSFLCRACDSDNVERSLFSPMGALVRGSLMGVLVPPIQLSEKLVI